MENLLFKVYFTYEVNLKVNEKISVLQGGREMWLFLKVCNCRPQVLFETCVAMKFVDDDDDELMNMMT